MKRTFIFIGTLLTLLIITVAGSKIVKEPTNSFGSVVRGSEYQSTTTSTVRFQTGSSVLCDTGGVLGSVVLTGQGTGPITFFNATTSNVSKREAKYSTSSILIANLPTLAATSTYVFDTVAPVGLLIDVQTTIPTSTVTYKCI